MSSPLTLSQLVTELQRLMKPGVIGTYQAIEVTELFALQRNTRTPINVLTIMVGDDNPLICSSPPTIGFLTRNLLNIPGIRDYSFGLVRYALYPTDLVAAIQKLDLTGTWAPAGKAVSLGPISPQRPTFVGANAVEPAAINGILKNNFWGGSHVIELSDPEKSKLRFLIETPGSLQALSEAVTPFCPLSIASLSDRLGNVLIQLPVTVMAASLAVDRSTAPTFTLDTAWKPGTPARPLQFSLEIGFDGQLSAAQVAIASPGRTAIPLPLGEGLETASLWDPNQNVLLWRQGPASRVHQIDLSTSISRPEARRFHHASDQDQVVIALKDTTNTVVASRSTRSKQETWTRQRLYTTERERFARERRFVQYKPTVPTSIGHEQALRDIRILIEQYGEVSTWLWDPYLCAADVLKTLFHSPHVNAELRALSDALTVPAAGKPKQLSWRRPLAYLFPRAKPARPTFAAVNRDELEALAGNREGLRLEFRARVGQAGWSFHDRFLIFPETADGPLAWSLGTSVNMVGHKHHILQKVDDGRLVADAFDELWSALTGPDQLVWKTDR